MANARLGVTNLSQGGAGRHRPISPRCSVALERFRAQDLTGVFVVPVGEVAVSPDEKELTFSIN